MTIVTDPSIFLDFLLSVYVFFPLPLLSLSPLTSLRLFLLEYAVCLPTRPLTSLLSRRVGPSNFLDPVQLVSSTASNYSRLRAPACALVLRRFPLCARCLLSVGLPAASTLSSAVNIRTARRSWSVSCQDRYLKRGQDHASETYATKRTPWASKQREYTYDDGDSIV